jgi:hypothetical protein
MARTRKAENRVPEPTASVESPIGAVVTAPEVASTTLAASDDKSDAFSVANREIDTLYQRVKEEGAPAIVVLRALNTVLTLKMRLITFRQSLLGRE